MVASKSIASPAQIVPDERQRQAIEHVSGPMLVVAGAGTGKTTVLTQRIARLIREGHARPDEVLALTYTENAAKEMRERVQGELRGTRLEGLQLKTFHAYCNELLIANGQQFGVLDEKDLWVYLRRRMPELHLRYFIRAANIGSFLGDLLEFLRRCQDELVGPEKYEEYVEQLGRCEVAVPRVLKSKDAAELSDEEVLGRCREIAQVFTTVERMLREENLGTFGHMITRAYALLTERPDLLEQERQHARFILVDEFQDANLAQIKILQSLAGSERNVFAVGDPDQAIYHFRGASSAAFQLFQRQFPETKIVALEKNRRSWTGILKCAFAVISCNPNFGQRSASSSAYERRELVSARDEEPKKDASDPAKSCVEGVVLTAKEAEGADVVSAIVQRRRQLRAQWKDFAVLYRRHDHTDDLVVELNHREVPFTIENMDVLDTPAARDLLACMGAVLSDADGGSLLRVAALPQFHIEGPKLRTAVQKLPRDAEATAMALALREVSGGEAVLAKLREARQEISTARVKARGALDILVRRFELDASSPITAALLEFVSGWEKKATTKIGTLPELMEYLEYFREAGGTICLPPSGEEKDAVRLMTVHAAKGLEFNHVFILRATSPSFPCSYHESLVGFPRELRDPDSITEDDDKELQAQEERRLFYVAMTRARDSLTISAKEGRGKIDKTPPGYLRELLKARHLGPWFRKREAFGFQAELFAQAAAPVAGSQTGEWLSLPPARNLDARLSASSIETYDRCPLQFKLEREWRIPGEVPAAMQYGAAMHLVLRDYYDAQRQGRARTDEEVIEQFRVVLREAGIQEPYQEQLYEKQGVEQLREFLAAARQSSTDVLHTEEFFEIKIGNTKVVGRIDRVDQVGEGCIAIVDYKTGKPKSQEDADKSLQLSIYAKAAKEKWGYNVERVAFYNLAGNESVNTLRDTLQLQEAESRVSKVAESIAAEKFPAKPGFYCRFCAYLNLCPAKEKQLQIRGAQTRAAKN